MMQKKLIVLFFILVSFIFFKSMIGPIETPRVPLNKSSHLHSVSSETTNHQVVIDVSNEATAFQDELDRHFKDLPTLGDLKNLTAEEAHHTPEVILEAGGLIGKVFDEAQKDPQKRSDAMVFFKKCAVDQEIVTAIRAVCLNKILNQVPEWGIPMTVTDAEISKEVFELAMKLTR